MQKNQPNIDILHWSLTDSDNDSNFKCYYHINDKFYKLKLILGLYFSGLNDENIQNFVYGFRQLSQEISIEELLDEDNIIYSTFFKQKISPYLRDRKINNIIHGK